MSDARDKEVDLRVVGVVVNVYGAGSAELLRQHPSPMVPYSPLVVVVDVELPGGKVARLEAPITAQHVVELLAGRNDGGGVRVGKRWQAIDLLHTVRG